MPVGLNSINSYVVNSYAGETIPLSANQTSSYATFSLAASKINNDVIVYNAGLKTAFITFGVQPATVTAIVPAIPGKLNCTPILAGAIMTFQKNSGATQSDTCAAITGGTDTTTLYFTSIQGS